MVAQQNLHLRFPWVVVCSNTKLRNLLEEGNFNVVFMVLWQ
jgi:hypothetical protein